MTIKGRKKKEVEGPSEMLRRMDEAAHECEAEKLKQKTTGKCL